MTIDPKAAELAKALTEATAKQEDPAYQDLIDAAHKKALIDHEVEQAYGKLQAHIRGERWAPKLPPAKLREGLGVLGEYAGHVLKIDRDTIREDETQTAKPNGGLTD